MAIQPSPLWTSWGYDLARGTLTPGMSTGIQLARLVARRAKAGFLLAHWCSPEVICTAVAIEGRRLVTAAHCIDASNELFVDGVPVHVIRTTSDLASLQPERWRPEWVETRIGRTPLQVGEFVVGHGYGFGIGPFLLFGVVSNVAESHSMTCRRRGARCWVQSAGSRAARLWIAAVSSSG